jgi:hypothetical protein
MAQQVTTRTIHTITIDIQDDVLAGICDTDIVEIVLAGRNGFTRPKTLTYRDITTLTADRDNYRKVR